MLRIKNVFPIDNYQLRMVFETNEEKIVDLSSIITKGVFKQLKDPAYFKQVINQEYFIEWPNEQDLSSDTLYCGFPEERRTSTNTA
jgi:hypothetical protein